MPLPPAVLPFPIPDSILLLIHLHLLECTLQLDPNMFNPNTCGIGDRIKNMEHVVHFLIGKAEGQQRAKVLLPMYPTKKPADTVSFRNAVVKYLEGLRTAAIKPQPAKQVTDTKLSGRINRPSRPVVNGDAVKKRPLPSKGSSVRSASATVSSSSLSSMSSKQPSSSRSVSVGTLKTGARASNEATTSVNTKHTGSSTSTPVRGWWWKDVPVRKSLLEECAGARFERLLIALSIHVLILHDAHSSSRDKPHRDVLTGLDSASNLDMFNMLCEQPDDYRDLIQRMSALQLRLSEEEQNLSRQNQAIRSLQASILSLQDHHQSSLQELQNRVSELTSALDSSWLATLDPERASEGSSNAQVGTGGNTPVLQWLLAIAGASRGPSKEDNLSVGAPEASNPKNVKGVRRSMANRKTILPAPPLPTVAANHASHIETLGTTKEKVAHLRAIQNLSQDETPRPEEALLQGSLPQQPRSILYDTLLGQEGDLSDSVQHFRNEMAELEGRLERELEIKQKMLIEAYNEEMQTSNAHTLDANHQNAWFPALRQPSKQFTLDFEMQSSAVPPVLFQVEQIPHHSEIANSIQRAIENVVTQARDAEVVEEWEESDASEQPYSAGTLESDGDEETFNKTIGVGSDELPRSPLKSTRIPTSSRTPKREVSIIQPKSTIRRPKFQDTQAPIDDFDRFDMTPKRRGEPSTPPRKNNQHFPQKTPTAVSFLQTPPKYSKQRVQATPSRTMATPSFFYSPGDAMEDLKEILPPFQSPWRSVSRAQRSPRKSGRPSTGKPRVSTHRPRPSKGRLASSTSFVRTPLKSGKRLSSIVPPVTFPLVKFGQATPRASLDHVYEEIVDDLVKSTTLKTPPSSIGARRLLDSNNNIQRSSPFKSLAGSGRGPRSPQSPEIGFEITEESEDEEQDVEMSFGTAGPLASQQMDEWEDVIEHAEVLGTPRQPVINTRTGPRFSEGPSFTLRDMLLKVGQDGVLGANGTFNIDLLQESEVDVGDDSMF